MVQTPPFGQQAPAFFSCLVAAVKGARGGFDAVSDDVMMMFMLLVTRFIPIFPEGCRYYWIILDHFDDISPGARLRPRTP